MYSRSYYEATPIEVGRVRGTVIDRLAYEVLDASVTNTLYISDLLRAYRESGALKVLRVVEDAIVSRLRSIYAGVGIEFDGEICFSKLADLGLIDEDTAVYLIATYISIEQAVEEIEELKELGKKVKIEKTLEEIASKLLEIVHVLSQLETPIPRYRSDHSYYTTDYVITGSTYVISMRGSPR